MNGDVVLGLGYQSLVLKGENARSCSRAFSSGLSFSNGDFLARP